MRWRGICINVERWRELAYGLLAVSVLPMCSCGGHDNGGPYAVSGTIKGLTGMGLVLLNNGVDATTVAANATQFTMNTALSNGATYSVTVGSQPYGISEACSPMQNSGTVRGVVSSIIIQCSAVTPIRHAVATYVFRPNGIAVDTAGNLFVVDEGDDSIKEIPYSATGYGTPVRIASGLDSPGDVAVDANGNLFVAEYSAIQEIPLNGDKYEAPRSIGTGEYLSAVAVDANGNVFVIDGQDIKEFPNTAGNYGAAILLGSGSSPISELSGLALDATGDVFVTDESVGFVTEIPVNGTAYGASVSIMADLVNAGGIAVDSRQNLIVFDSDGVKRIPFTNGSYGAPVSLGGAMAVPFTVATDAQHGAVIFAGNDGPGTPEQIVRVDEASWESTQVGLGLSGVIGVAVDTTGNVLVSDDDGVKRIGLSGGQYSGSAVLIGGDLPPPQGGLAVDIAGDVFVADLSNSAVRLIPYRNGQYGMPLEIGTGLVSPVAVAVDAAGNVFVADNSQDNNPTVKKIPSTGSSYGESITVGSGFESMFGGSSEPPTLSGIALDSRGNIFVTATDPVYTIGFITQSNAVIEIPYDGSKYGALTLVSSSFNQETGLLGLTVAKTSNIFVAQNGTPVAEIPYSETGYGSPVNVDSSFYNPQAIATDSNGRLYVVDSGEVWMLAP